MSAPAKRRPRVTAPLPPPAASVAPAAPVAPSMPLYTQTSYARAPRDVNAVVRDRRQATRQAVRAAPTWGARFNAANEVLAVFIVQKVGTMGCAYIFAALALLGFPGFHATAQAYVQWVSQTFIQLVMLSILMVGQNVLSRHGELLAEEMFHATMRALRHEEQNAHHLGAQDAEMLEQRRLLLRVAERLFGDADGDGRLDDDPANDPTNDAPDAVALTIDTPTTSVPDVSRDAPRRPRQGGQATRRRGGSTR